ncbi:MAG TPA: substrate-binding domain-containing protein [Streptosporangiaceae bacterium]|nr:substrate-binding domain-containing protein [Streptosporangiaceae bacterium]
MSVSRPSRRWALAAALAAVTLTAAACSSSSPSSGGSSGKTSSAKHYTIAFVPGATGVSFYDTVLHGMQAKAKSLGMTVTYQGSPDFAPSAQTPVVDGVCSKHPSVLVVAPTDPVAMAPAINTCLNAGIPVITVDTQLSNTSRLTAEITTDNTEGGKLAGAYLGKALHGTGQIAELSLSPTATTQVDRLQAVDSVLKSSYPGIKVATLQYTQQATSSSETTVRSILSAHPQVKAIFGVAEPNAEGAIDALAAAGLTGKVLVVGWDASPAEVSLLKKGTLSATVAQQAAQEGAMAAQYAFDKLTGKASAITFHLSLPDVLLTSANVSQDARYYYLP